MTTAVFPSTLSDKALLSNLSDLVSRDNALEADILVHIAEVDRRRLYRERACSSMFRYCVTVLNFSEYVAGHRIGAARVCRKFPALFDMVRDGRLHISGIKVLGPTLTADNFDELTTRAAHKTREQIEHLVATYNPKPDAPAAVRKLPKRRRTVASRQPHESTQCQQAPGLVNAAKTKPEPISDPAPPAPGSKRPAFKLTPTAQDRFKVQFTASAQLSDQLRRLIALLRGQNPNAGLVEAIEYAVEAGLAKREKAKFSKTDKPRSTPTGVDPTPTSRRIPNAVKRRVAARDKGRCAFVDIETGRRCDVTDNVEFHHVVPFARGGDHSVDNIRLLCRAHNGLLAEIEFGDRARRHRRDGPVFDGA